MSIRTAYCECLNIVWDYYIKMPNHKYTPILWIGSERQQKTDSYNEIKFINRNDFFNCNLQLSYSNEINNGYDSLYSDKILECLIQRISLGKKTNIKDYQSIIRHYINLWCFLIDKYNLYALVLPEPPHIPYSYIGYKIFKKRGLKTIMTATTPFNHTFIINKFTSFDFFNKGYIKNGFDKPENEIYLRKIQKEYSFQSSFGVNKQIKPFYKIIQQIYLIIKSLLNGNKYPFFIASKGKLVRVSQMYYHTIVLKNSLKKIILKKFYQNNSLKKTLSNSRKKILFALHFEPEMALYPLGGKYFNQLKAINDLTQILGNDFEVYVKEHPWQFRLDKNNGYVREIEFYKKILKCKNVYLVDVNFNINNNIDQFDIISTVTGTIGWELVIKNKPVVVFSKPWYYGLPNVFYFERKANFLNDVLKRFIDKSSVDYKDIYFRLKQMLPISIRRYDLAEEEYIKYSSILKTAIEEG